MLFGRNLTSEITANGAKDVPLAAGLHFRYMAAREIYCARFGIIYNFVSYIKGRISPILFYL
jgi:hypothetical protein